jgi:hypothetical protein
MQINFIDMDNSGTSANAAIITGLSSIAAAIIGAIALIGKGKWWAKKPAIASKEGTKITSQTGDGSNSFIAVGDNIMQHQGTIHNYYGAESSATVPFDAKVATRPSLVEITNTIRSAKPYEKTQLPLRYAGIDVCWLVGFYSMHTDHRGRWLVTFLTLDLPERVVSTNIDIENYPKLKVIEVGHRVWIEGRICDADDISVQLEDGARITLED